MANQPAPTYDDTDRPAGESMGDASLTHALAATFTPDELNRLGRHLSRRVGDAAAVLARLGDAVNAGRELHAAILADGAHAAGCHASPHGDDCRCWCHRSADDYDYGETKAAALRALRWDNNGLAQR